MNNAPPPPRSRAGVCRSGVLRPERAPRTIASPQPTSELTAGLAHFQDGTPQNLRPCGLPHHCASTGSPLTSPSSGDAGARLTAEHTLCRGRSIGAGAEANLHSSPAPPPPPPGPAHPICLPPQSWVPSAAPLPAWPRHPGPRVSLRGTGAAVQEGRGALGYCRLRGSHRHSNASRWPGAARTIAIWGGGGWVAALASGQEGSPGGSWGSPTGETSRPAPHAAVAGETPRPGLPSCR